MAGQLIAALEEWRRKHESFTIVTHGYSKAVREVLLQDWNSLGCSRVFLLVGPDEARIDARMMERELESAGGEVGVGTSEAIAKLIGADERVLMLLGAECWDEKRVTCHARRCNVAKQ